MSGKQPKSKYRRKANYVWNGESIRALREHMNLTQREMAEELEVRQQTISEWEQSLYVPRRSSCKLLTMFAVDKGFIKKK